MVLLWAVGCTRVVAEVVDAPPGHLTVLHTNDLHAHYEPEVADWLPNRPAIGGFIRLDAEVQAIRANRGPDGVLLFDAGDLNTGTPLGEIDVNGAKGAAMLQFLDLLRYDAWALGNHEFDKGLENLRRYARSSTIPILSANIHNKDGSLLLANQEHSHVFERNGLRVGVIGATTEGLRTLMRPSEYATLSVTRVADAVRAEVARLDPETDLLVVLSHIGIDDDRALARAVPGIDLIVGGHSHTHLEVAEQVDGTWIVQAGSYTRSLGIVDLVVEGDRITNFHYSLRDLTPDTSPGPPTPKVVSLVAGYDAQIDALYGEVVGNATAVLNRDYHHESGVGQLVAEIMRDAAQTEVGLYNGGGLRADIEAGPVTLRSLYDVLAFGNQLMRFSITGAQLQALLLRNAAAEADEQHGFLPVSGVRYTWRVRVGAPELVDVSVGGVPLDLARSYSIATNSYVVEQWARFLGFEPKDAVSTGISDYEAAVAWVREHPTLSPPSEAHAIRVRE